MKMNNENYKTGQEAVYHDSGEIFRVKIIGIKEEMYGKTRGKIYQLKLLEVISTNSQNPPSSGLEFSVWKAENSGGYGWHLLDK